MVSKSKLSFQSRGIMLRWRDKIINESRSPGRKKVFNFASNSVDVFNNGVTLFFFQMKLSSTLFAVMILGIISLSSANRIPPHQPSCVTYCGNYAKRCDLQLQGCPLESCDIGDRDCLFNECMAYFHCNVQRKREKSDVIVETIWGSKAVDKEFSYCESWTERNNSKSLFLHFVYDSLM